MPLGNENAVPVKVCLVGLPTAMSVQYLTLAAVQYPIRDGS
jgi:hypothetical protein